MIKFSLIIPKDRYNYYQYSLFLSKIQNEFNFTVVSIDTKDTTFNNIDPLSQYVIILKRYCYIDFKKLNKLISSTQSKKPYTIWHNTNIAILHRSIFKKFSSITEVDKYLESLKQTNIYDITKYCYMTNIGLIKSKYHTAIFVCLDDNDEQFNIWLNEFHTKNKKIYYRGHAYDLKIGKNFFIKNNIHIGILPNKQIVYWSNKKQHWELANNRILKLITIKEKI